MSRKEEMTSLERVATTLQFKEPDRVPAAPLVCGASCRVAGISLGEWSEGDNVEMMVRGHLESLELIGHDGVVMLVDLSVEAADFGCCRDPVGFLELQGGCHPFKTRHFLFP